MTKTSKNIVLNYFQEILQIGRPSGQEQNIRKYIIDVLKKHNIKVNVDKIGNVYAYKRGNIHAPSILFQAHMDMVCVKQQGSKHDFMKDPIQVYEEDGFLKAKGTTLGADDGIGIAMILALFTDNALKHGNLEALFTVEEETTCAGASQSKSGVFKSNYLINLDNEEKDKITIGTCECIKQELVFPIKKQAQIKQTSNISISILNAKGGHSGVEIHKPHISVIKEMFTTLKFIKNELSFLIVDVTSDNLSNVIPGKIEVVVNVDNLQKHKFKKLISDSFKNIKKEYSYCEPNLSFKVQELKNNNLLQTLTTLDTNKLIDFVCIAPDGLRKYDFNLNVSQSSTNFAKIILDSDTIKCEWMHRTMTQYQMIDYENEFLALASWVKGKTKLSEYLAGWAPDWNNKLALATQAIAKKKLHHDMSIIAINAGAEVSEIIKKYPHMVGICIGPEIRDAHSINERIEIKSIDIIYNLLKEILVNIK